MNLSKKIFALTAASIALTQISSTPAQSCATSSTHTQKIKAGAWKKYFTEHKKTNAVKDRKPSNINDLPNAVMEPWGGSSSSNWQPEAITANAASEALNDGWQQSNVEDVLVTIPVQMLFGSIRPYGDGQTNASLALGNNWNKTEPALVATLIQFKNGASKIKLRFHRSFNLGSQGVSLTHYKGGQAQTLKISQTRKSNQGDFEYETDLSNSGPQWGDLFQNQVAFVKPDQFTDWFPIDFRNVVKPAGELLAQIPESNRRLGNGNLLDPENVSAQNRNDDYFPFLGMADENFGSNINADRYFPVPGSGIHNEFARNNDGTRITAVGHGNTLVMIKSPAPFKLAYICFDARNQNEEANYGVPSGGGWHEIGDPAETVFNSLEKVPALFGYANTLPTRSTPSGGFAYGLTDIALYRLLKPGSALITAAGPTTASEDSSGWQNRGNQSVREGRNFHWFAFHQNHEVCALEWVHPKIPSPSNHLGMDR